jgi:hypothetical protein
MSYEDVLIREQVGDGTIDPDDVCYVCDKLDCVCPTEDHGGNIIPDRVQANHDHFRDILPVNIICPCPVLAETKEELDTRSIRDVGEARESTQPTSLKDDRLHLRGNSPDSRGGQKLCSVGDSDGDVCVFPAPSEYPLQLTWPTEPTNFSDWLQKHGDALTLPESFRDWLDQTGYEIQ